MEFYILFVSKYCVIKIHFLDHLPVVFIVLTFKKPAPSDQNLRCINFFTTGCQ